MKPIYIPKGRAKEYADIAINIYTGCNHGCTYCYAPLVLHKSKEAFMHVEPRKNIIEATKRQLSNEKYEGKTITLCFLCDPYPAKVDTTQTRKIIKAIKEAGAHVQILTKAGGDPERDFDLLDENDSFGVTISCISKANIVEPHAGSIIKRLDLLHTAHNAGIKTWVSCEPVIDASDIYGLISTCNDIDLFKIGVLNYFPSDIDWGKFGKECERLCKQYGRNYYLKQDLRNLMK